MKRNSIVIIAITSAVVLAVIGVGMMFSATVLAPTIPETVVPTATNTPRIPRPSGTRLQFETTAGTEPNPAAIFGSVNVSYPLRFSPGSSDVLRVLVQRPPALASLTAGDFDRIPIPPDAPPIVGTVNHYEATILIQNSMRMELTSPTFAVDALNATEQPVNTNPGSEATLWAWTVVAPEAPGLHVLVVQAFLGADSAPVWARSFQVEVLSADTLRDTPFLESSGGKIIIGAVTTIIAALIGLFGTLAGKGIILKPKDG